MHQMAENQLLSFVAERLSNIEDSLVEQATVRERIIVRLDSYNETHRREHGELKEKLQRLEESINPMIQERIGRQQLRGTAHRFGKTISLVAAAATAMFAFWDYIKKILGVLP
jgi:enterochelin esterase-like enzyme